MGRADAEEKYQVGKNCFCCAPRPALFDHFFNELLEVVFLQIAHHDAWRRTLFARIFAVKVRLANHYFFLSKVLAKPSRRLEFRF